jgi:hypothetical protein
MVPTSKRGLRFVDFGRWNRRDQASMKSTSGLSICPRTAGKADSDSNVAGCPSAKMVSKAARTSGAGPAVKTIRRRGQQIKIDSTKIVLARA